MAYFNRALTYHAMGEYQQAIEDYNQALRLNPSFGLAYSNRGQAYHDLRQLERAVRDWHKACELGYKPAFELVE